jgi:hypothetical protein
MLARQRQATILDLVRQRGGGPGSDLVKVLAAQVRELTLVTVTSDGHPVDSTDAREGQPAGPADAPAERTAVP